MDAAEFASREAVIAEAESWEGTPYHQRAAIKGVGTDCARYPAAVYASCGLIRAIDPGNYASDWHLHQQVEVYLRWARMLGREIPEAEAQRGDFGLWKFGLCFSHGAILLGGRQIIHATWRGHCVHKSDMDRDDDLAGREVKFFTLWPQRS